MAARHFTCLIFPELSVILRAMFRLVIIFISIIWASLLLVSWSSPPEAAPRPMPAIENAS